MLVFSGMPIFTCFTITEAVSGTVMGVCVCVCGSACMRVFVFITPLPIMFNQLFMNVCLLPLYICMLWCGVACSECLSLYPPPLFAHCWCPPPRLCQTTGFPVTCFSLIWWHLEHLSLHYVRCCYPNLWSGNVCSMGGYQVLLTIEYIEPF